MLILLVSPIAFSSAQLVNDPQLLTNVPVDISTAGTRNVANDQAIHTTSTYQYLITESGKSRLWFERDNLSLSGMSLARLLADLGWYQPKSLVSSMDGAREQQIIKLDRQLTNGFVKLMSIANIDETQTNETSNALYLANVLLDAISQDNTDELLLSLIPEYDQISQLRKAISEYRYLAKHPWPKLNSSFKPKLGQSHKYVKGIREILTILGDMPESAQTKTRLDVFDSVVVASLKSFQRRHGLESDGKLGPKTYAALQVSPQQRVKQLQVNLWRWFALPSKPPENYLMVNIPGYQLTVFEQGSINFDMKVIVGDIENQTPTMITEINRITVNPTWTPTSNIIKNELIPEYKQDFLSLKRKNFQLVKGYWKNIVTREIDDPGLNFNELLRSYRLVQAPGENNALGYYRFNIPNNYSVYLHDTPVKSLFGREQRALSHGCIRLEDAKGLAEYLIKSENSVTLQTAQSALQSGKTTNFPLNKALPVFITYQTAWIDKYGKLRLSPDIYNLDHKKQSIAQLRATVSNPVITLSQNTL
ncbi:L,D-transpeptidase family protein [Thalassotalea crassostreae]|uniref:L,D-transpeptidase family protein n=1 Tax=Thalassotalea crassostreae TaxID=1763536 RepID=UPI000838A840|nr:L,D-transpeptidase family protein [Thalassotalea crassostreae]